MCFLNQHITTLRSPQRNNRLCTHRIFSNNLSPKHPLFLCLVFLSLKLVRNRLIKNLSRCALINDSNSKCTMLWKMSFPVIACITNSHSLHKHFQQDKRFLIIYISNNVELFLQLFGEFAQNSVALPLCIVHDLGFILTFCMENRHNLGLIPGFFRLRGALISLILSQQTFFVVVFN